MTGLLPSFLCRFVLFSAREPAVLRVFFISRRNIAVSRRDPPYFDKMCYDTKERGTACAIVHKLNKKRGEIIRIALNVSPPRGGVLAFYLTYFRKNRAYKTGNSAKSNEKSLLS